jgi:hypothetical protein
MIKIFYCGAIVLPLPREMTSIGSRRLLGWARPLSGPGCHHHEGTLL